VSSRDPKCVYVADSMGLAEVVATWLAEQGFPAEVMNQATLGGLRGLTPYALSGVSADGVEVWVQDAAHADDARKALAEQARRAAAEQAAREAAPPVEVVCEDCNQTSTFAGKERGSVQDCPHCGAYLDVPGDDDSGPSEWEKQEPE
jgi:hypothetical protein